MTVNNTKFMDGLTETLLTKKVGLSSIKLYLQKLVQLNSGKSFANLSFLKDTGGSVGEVLDKIENINTLRSMLTAVTSVLNHSELGKTRTYKAVTEVWKKKLDDVIVLIRAKPTGLKTSKQEKNWLEWKEVEAIYKTLSDKVKNFTKSSVEASLAQRRAMTSHTLLALYVLIPPRRNLDYLMLCSGDIDGDEDYNWYDGKSLVFNVYKTQSHYGKEAFEVPAKLQAVLNDTIRLRGITKGGRLLIDENGKELNDSATITKLLNKIFGKYGKKISSTMLRHIFVSSKYSSIKNEMEVDAHKMSHSVATQQGVYNVE
jgi:hypothetical protein